MPQLMSPASNVFQIDTCGACMHMSGVHCLRRHAAKCKIARLLASAPKADQGERCDDDLNRRWLSKGIPVWDGKLVPRPVQQLRVLPHLNENCANIKCELEFRPPDMIPARQVLSRCMGSGSRMIHGAQCTGPAYSRDVHVQHSPAYLCWLDQFSQRLVLRPSELVLGRASCMQCLC